MNQNVKSFSNIYEINQTRSIGFVGLKCPVCGKNLIMIKKFLPPHMKVQALLPGNEDEAFASVKCPCQKGPVPIRLVVNLESYRANTAN